MLIVTIISSRSSYKVLPIYIIATLYNSHTHSIPVLCAEMGPAVYEKTKTI